MNLLIDKNMKLFIKKLLFESGFFYRVNTCAGRKLAANFFS